MVDIALESVVGGKAAKELRSLDIATVDDLLSHYPRRYYDTGNFTDLGSLVLGEEVTVVAKVARIDARRFDRGSSAGRKGVKSLTTVVITDGQARLDLKFFNMASVSHVLREGKIGLFAGTVRRFQDKYELMHPAFQVLGEATGGDTAGALADIGTRLLAIYPATAKCPSWKIAAAVELALPHAQDDPDPLSPTLREQAGVIERAQALRWIHQPPDFAKLQLAKRRLRWDEAFTLQVLLAQRRAAAAAEAATVRPGRPGGLRDRFDAQPPFTLTAGQVAIGKQLDTDLARPHPLARLLQGEVGSGKTVVALRAMLQVIDSGGQCALLAPTEVLAAQHARSLTQLLGAMAAGGQLGAEPDATQVVLITGSQTTQPRREALLAAASGQAGIVVGTHALLEDKVQFADLGLVVIDEQHRFGVEQRAALLGKARAGTRPHLLVMTATPIPRTVAMTVFGDLEVSTLTELPAGRAPLQTHVVAAAEQPTHFARVWQRAREEVAAGRQVYVVCPRVDQTDDDAPALPAPATVGHADDAPLPPAAAVNAVIARLAAQELLGLRLAALTGRFSGAEKDQIIARFADPGRADGVDVLVATTVIEVGVDVPNATLMIILDADRFGVSQLHQLRGRVGRGGHQGICLLVTFAPPETPARARLAAVAATTDGFELSRYDLEERREGDVLGAAQSGATKSLKLLSVIKHEEIIKRARERATELVAADPGLSKHPLLASRIAAMIDDEQAEYLEKS
ncbi:MAG: ATP-dependent DNA helicase RecG [Candidatus Nanopelagicales bacterium]